MRMKFLALTTLIFSFSANATDPAGYYMVYADGGLSCKDVNKSSKDEILQRASWLAGYLTAINAASNNSTNVLEGTNFDGAMTWVSKYCQANPSATYEHAALEVVLELRKNHGL